METGSQIMLLRERKGISREQMADNLGMHVNTYKNIEYGKKIPDLNEIQKIAEILEIDPALFLSTYQPVFSKIKNSPGTGIGNTVINDTELVRCLTNTLEKLTAVLEKMKIKL